MIKHKPKELMRVFEGDALEDVKQLGAKSIKVLVADEDPAVELRVGFSLNYLVKRKIKSAVNKLKNQKRHEINKVIKRLEITINKTKRLPLQAEITRLENEFFLMFAWRFNYEWE